MLKSTRTKYLYILLVLFFGLALIVSGCATDESSVEPDESGEETDGAVEPDNQTYSIHVCGQGSRMDASFYQSMYEGFTYIQEKYPDYDITFADLVPQAETLSHMESIAASGVDLVLTELAFFEAVLEVAPRYPDTWFLVMNVMDTTGLPANLTSMAWRVEQGGYLAGIIAGKMTETNNLGFIAGFDYPDIIKVGSGFILGAKSVNPEANLSVVYTGSWVDVQKAYDAAKVMINNGVDVILHQVDEGAYGIIDAAEESNIFIVGEIRDQRYLSEELNLTSFLTNHALMFEYAVENLINGTMKQEVKFFGIEEGDVIAPIGDMVPDDVKALVEEARAKIEAGELTIPEIDNPQDFEAVQ